MINITVSTPFAPSEEDKKNTLSIEGRTLDEVLEKLNNHVGEKTKENIFNSDEGVLKQNVNVFVDGRNIETGKTSVPLIKDGSSVLIMPMVAGGTPDEKFFGFDEEQIKRYSRQIVLPELGGRGQRKLLDSNVLIVGAGALGSPAALYLAGAGVGKIGIVDSDKVELSNLQRQIIHGIESIGKDKITSAKERISDTNPDVKVRTYKERLDKDNIFDILDAGWDIVLDASDNFPTKFLLNDACFMRDIPLSHAGILRFTGIVTTILPEKGPCYRCFTPEAPPPDSVPSCQEAGVLGAIPGVIGSIQATEVLKYLLDIETLLNGRFLIFDGKDMSFEEIKFSPRENCPLCGENPKIEDLDQVDYGDTCQVSF